MKLTIRGENRQITLDASKEISRGGEGAIYQHPTNKQLVAKVYHKGVKPNITDQSVKELSKLPKEFVCPLNILEDTSKTIVGFTMRFIDTSTYTLLSLLFNKATSAKQGLSDIRLRTKVCHSILACMTAAHNLGIIIGDFNPYNLYVSRSGEVVFIDVDSYQTSSRPHSGVMLPEIRDWINANEVTARTDCYALAVMAFQVLTYMHPYKGIHNTFKSLQERVIHHLSVLSGDKNIILPAFYEKLTNATDETSFKSIFQNDARYPIAVGLSSTATPLPIAPPRPVVATGGVVVTPICTDMDSFESALYYCVAKKSDGTHSIYDVSQRHVCTYVTSVKETLVLPTVYGILTSTAHDVNYVTFKGQHTGTVRLNNLRVTPKYVLNSTYMLMFDDIADSYSIIDLDKIFNNNIKIIGRGEIFVRSLEIRDAAIQNVGTDGKWIIYPTEYGLMTLRTLYNIANAYISNDIVMLEYKDKTGIKYGLFKIQGMALQPAMAMTSFVYIDAPGSIIFAPGNGCIDVISKSSMQITTKMDCPVVTEQSILKSCAAGILCQTGNELFLLNKS